MLMLTLTHGKEKKYVLPHTMQAAHICGKTDYPEVKYKGEWVAPSTGQVENQSKATTDTLLEMCVTIVTAHSLLSYMDIHGGRYYHVELARIINLDLMRPTKEASKCKKL